MTETIHLSAGVDCPVNDPEMFIEVAPTDLDSKCLNYWACLRNSGICVAAVCSYPDPE